MKKIIIIWLPCFTGLLLFALAAFDLHQFRSNSIDAQTMLNREMPFVVLGLCSSFVVFASAFYWLLKKHWLMAFQACLSPVLFLVFFTIGGAMGAAYLNVT